MLTIIEEASTIGLQPGEWPNTIIHKGVAYRRDKAEIRNGELTAVTYLTDDATLVVLND